MEFVRELPSGKAKNVVWGMKFGIFA